MKTIKHNGVEYAVGLSWTRLAGEKLTSEIAAAVEERDMEYGLVRRGSDLTYIGLTDESALAGKFSAAAMLAEHADNVVLVEHINDDQYWICCVINGEVVPSGDAVVNAASVGEIVSDLSNIPMPEDTFTEVYASEEVAEDFDIDVGGHLTFADIIGEKTPDKSMKVLKIKKGIGIIPIIFGLAFIGAGAVGGYIVLSDDSAARMAELQRKMDSRPQKPEVDLEQVKADARAEERKWFNEDFTKQDMVGGLNSALKVFGDIESLNRGGWKFEGLTLDKVGSADKFVVVEWVKQNGTTASLTNSLEAGAYNFHLGGTSATTSHIVSATKELKEGVYDNVIKGSADSYLALMDKFDSIPEARWEMVKNATKKNRKKMIQHLPPNQANSKQLPVTIRDFRMSGASYESLNMLKAILSQKEHQNVLLNKVQIKYDAELTWTVTGEIYEN